MKTGGSIQKSAKRIVVVGAGGNIGSHLVTHLARIPGVECIALIDKDVYEPSNLNSQDITPGDVGKLKAVVQARRLRRINPKLRVESLARAVEGVPLGRLRGDVILACLDSRIARQHVSQFAWRLGVPLIDAGVEPGGLLARINVYAPGLDAPCMECAWDDRDYEALEQAYPCLGGVSTVAATNALSSLGALAASLQAIECKKLLDGQIDRLAASRQVIVDALHHKHYVTVFHKNPDCRFAGHDVWHIERLEHSARQIKLAEALKLAPATSAGDGSVTLRVEGKPFATRLTCPNCGKTRSLLRLECSIEQTDRCCSRCGSLMIAAGFDLAEELSAQSLKGAGLLQRSLRSVGLRPGEIFSIKERENERHYELASD